MKGNAPEHTFVRLELPEGCKQGSIILVTWDCVASARRGVEGIFPEPQEGRVTRIEGNLVTVRFIYAPDREYDGPLDETIGIDLATGLDLKYED